MPATRDVLKINGLSKDFTLHLQDGLVLPVLDGIDLTLKAGECVALTGASGAGKSTLMRMVYANYLCTQGSIRVRHDGAWTDLASATPHQVLQLRRHTIGYVSQFLRVIPRIPTLDIVAEPAVARGVSRDEALERARVLLSRLRVPERLWSLPPATFSGGEQQRVNVARGFIARHALLLLDEPTASLDADNRETVLSLIEEAKADGIAILGIFHDLEARTRVCDRLFDVLPQAAAA